MGDVLRFGAISIGDVAALKRPRMIPRVRQTSGVMQSWLDLPESVA